MRKFYFFLITFLISSNIFSATFTSTDEKSGNWASASIWEGGTAPSTSLGNNNTITINGTVEVSTSLVFNNNAKLIISTGDTLIISGDLLVNTNAVITVNTGGVLIVFGSFDSENNLDIASDGKAVVFGDFTVANNTTVTISSANSLYVFGTATLTGVIFPISSSVGSQDSFLSGEPTLTTWLNQEYKTELPIELEIFDVFVTPQEIQFSWITKSETNNDYFTIQYSLDGINYIDIDQIQGAGTSSDERIYEYGYQNFELSGIVYFRLQQTDYNGLSSFSPIISIKLKSDEIDFFVYPVPAKDFIVIEDNSGSIINVRFYDQLLQEIDVQRFGFEYDISSLPKGVYIIKIDTKSGTVYKEFVK